MMKLKHLIELIAELKPNTFLKYIRSDEHCEYIKVDLNEPRVFSKTPDGKEHSIAGTYLQILAERIEENVPFNISQLMNNSGSNRPIIETIIAHTKEFYWLQNGRARYVVWLPSRPHEIGKLIEWMDESIIKATAITPIVKSIDQLIVNDISNHKYSEQELGHLLKQMYESGSNDHTQASRVHLFGLKYGLIIRSNSDLSIKHIVNIAGISENYVAEINKGTNLAELISKNTYGVAFWNEKMSIKKRINTAYLHSSVDRAIQRYSIVCT